MPLGSDGIEESERERASERASERARDRATERERERGKEKEGGRAGETERARKRAREREGRREGESRNLDAMPLGGDGVEESDVDSGEREEVREHAEEHCRSKDSRHRHAQDDLRNERGAPMVDDLQRSSAVSNAR
eukprot:1404000-Rhodomonas_salina.1